MVFSYLKKSKIWGHKELTKICSNCGNENKNTSKFCEKCGTTLVDTTIKSKSNIESLKSSWNKQSSGVKAIMGIAGVCCLGLIILVVIGGMFSPDVNTSNTTLTSSENATTNNLTSNNNVSSKSNASENALDFWATNYPNLNDKCPECGNKAQLEEKTDKIYTFYCPNCNAIYGVNLLGSDKEIGWDPQDGVSEMKYFPRK